MQPEMQVDPFGLAGASDDYMNAIRAWSEQFRVPLLPSTSSQCSYSVSPLQSVSTTSLDSSAAYAAFSPTNATVGLSMDFSELAIRSLDPTQILVRGNTPAGARCLSSPPVFNVTAPTPEQEFPSGPSIFLYNHPTSSFPANASLPNAASIAQELVPPRTPLPIATTSTDAQAKKPRTSPKSRYHPVGSSQTDDDVDLQATPSSLSLSRKRGRRGKAGQTTESPILTADERPSTPLTATTSETAHLPVTDTIPPKLLADLARDLFAKELSDLTPEELQACVGNIMARRARNTESARRSRVRRQEQLETMEARIEELQEENGALRERVAELEARLRARGDKV